ncbi:hypothetical protein ACIGCP_06685 [Cellulophaga baltica]|uniref:hypothetical protein n=1 Tax=Cellulophaga baltica TaxID=76594 RepID=UPI0037C5B27C
MKKFYILSLFSLILVFGSCKETADKSTTSSPTENTTTEEVSYSDAQVVLSTPAGEEIGGFSLSPMTIYAGNTKYTSKNKSEKHKYYTHGDLAFEVKFKSDGFKLRDKNSALLWKIKMYPDKIKISDNEENTNAFEIKRYEEKIKIKQNDDELYTVALEDATISANDTVLYKLSANQESYAYAIMALKEIPEEQRIFILAEVLAQL